MLPIFTLIWEFTACICLLDNRMGRASLSRDLWGRVQGVGLMRWVNTVPMALAIPSAHGADTRQARFISECILTLSSIFVGPGTFPHPWVGSSDPEGCSGVGWLYERSVSLMHWRHEPWGGHPQVGLRPTRGFRNSRQGFRHDPAKDPPHQRHQDAHSRRGRRNA